MIQQHHSKNGAARMYAATVAELHADQGHLRPNRGMPRLLDLINIHHVSTIHLARAARLRLDTVRAMALQGKPVQSVVAMQVLYGLWKLTGTFYILTDIDIPTLPYN